jgi:SAM-dependent methyltransferase
MDTLSAMKNTLHAARRHYAAVGLTERLEEALSVFGPDDQQLTVSQLGPVDQFHTRGLEATAELARLTELRPDMQVLDVGAGIGGPARFIADKFGCVVTGVDLSEAFVDAARYLAERTGQAEQVTFITANALELPFGDAAFDAIFLQHVAMNIGDRAGLYREMRRVLKQKGRFATFDVVLKDGDPTYPLPWSSSAEGSFLMTADDTRRAIEAAGFRSLLFRDDSEAAKLWIGKLQASGPPAPPNLGTVMGPNFGELTVNLGRALMQGRLGILMAVFEAN